MKATTDQLLIQQLREPASRRQAFARLVDTYGKQLYWQIRKLVTYHDDADDVLQNTLIKAWNNIDSFRAESKLSTWLFTIAYRESITFLSRRKETLSLDNALDGNGSDSDDEPSASFADMLTADEYFDGDQAQALLQQAINTLPPKQKAVFCMKYFDEMKYDDMSTITGTSVGALKASFHLAVKKIEEFVRNREI